MTLLIISFIAGVLTILAPCVLPLLPVIVGHSISDSTLSKRRLFTVVISLGVSVILFTIILKASTLLVDIPEDFWKWISGGIIFLFGLTMVFPSLWEKLSFINIISRKSNEVLTKGYKKDNIWGDIIIGASLGPIFSACSPTYFVILATVLPATPVLGVVYLLTYVLGLCLSLLVVALLGQKIMIRLGSVSDPRGWFKRIIGLIFIVVAIGIISGYDKDFQIKILDSGFLDVTKIEQKLLDNSARDILNDNETNINNNTEDIPTDNANVVTNSIKANNKFLNITQKKKKYNFAPDISTPDGFINTDGKPITISEFKDKNVVLLDIWTYSCINCQRTLPYLNKWYKEYEDDGLVIIGLHTPEFSFERVQSNVEKAVKDFDIKYPVVLDNDFSTWNSLGNHYWPRKYLIDIDGYIVYDHAGEGDYDKTEKAIQDALEERAYRLGMNSDISSNISDPSNVVSVDMSKVKSPEIYFGSNRNEYFANGKKNTEGEQTLSIPSKMFYNLLYLGGVWDFSPEYATNKNSASIVFSYEAKNVYMAAGSDNASGVDVEIYKDDVLVKKVNIKDEKLYPLIEGDDYGKHTLKIKIPNTGLKAFTFTFG